jgi:hypothetical protein
VAIGTTVLAAGIGNGGHGPSHPGQAQGQHPSLPPSGSPPHAQPTTPSVRPSTSNAVVATPTTTSTTIAPVATGPAANVTPSLAPQNLVGAALPISVESDAQMQAEGNSGPSSSILVPESCELNGTTVTAEGGYQGGSPRMSTTDTATLLSSTCSERRRPVIRKGPSSPHHPSRTLLLSGDMELGRSLLSSAQTFHRPQDARLRHSRHRTSSWLPNCAPPLIDCIARLQRSTRPAGLQHPLPPNARTGRSSGCYPCIAMRSVRTVTRIRISPSRRMG